MAVTKGTMTDEQRKSVALEYLKAFDNKGVTSTGGSILDLFADDAHKEARGLVSASLSSPTSYSFAVPISWKIQGNKGGEDIADPVRGPMNEGGQYGERNGWHLPGFDDSGWERATEYTSERVRPDGDYVADAFTGARFIWTADIDLDNTVVFRNETPELEKK